MRASLMTTMAASVLAVGLSLAPAQSRPFGFRAADCGRLRQRALDTGSRYWWRQYHRCVH